MLMLLFFHFVILISDSVTLGLSGQQKLILPLLDESVEDASDDFGHVLDDEGGSWKAELIVKNPEISVQVGDWKNLTFYLSNNLIYQAEIQLGVVDKNVANLLSLIPKDGKVSLDLNCSEISLKIKALGAKSRIIFRAEHCNSSSPKENNTYGGNCTGLNYSKAFYRLTFVNYYVLALICDIVGWIYFAAWSVSFYPQIYENWKRKSVVGLNFDFLALNITGFLCYSIFNCLLFWSHTVQSQYFVEEGQYAVNPVLINDVAFAVHAAAATIFTIFQCFIYERGNQRVSHTCKFLLALFWTFAVVSVILGGTQVISWYEFAKFLSYIKLAVTTVKYIPQAYYNFRRKSTVGWSIGNILLDFTGGSMSILQMVLQSYNENDWTTFFGDPTKFGLGILSVVFDILFMVQHYVLYRGATSAYEGLAEEEGSPSENGSNNEETEVKAATEKARIVSAEET